MHSEAIEISETGHQKSNFLSFQDYFHHFIRKYHNAVKLIQKTMLIKMFNIKAG